MLKKYLILPLFAFVMVALGSTACGELAKIKSSSDASLKYDYAKKMYNLGKYKKASELLETVLPYYEGTREGSRVLYMLAYSEYERKDYTTASDLFIRYYTSYPDGDEAESARFFAGKSLFKSMPDARLDQTTTYAAIRNCSFSMKCIPKANGERRSVKCFLRYRTTLPRNSY